MALASKILLSSSATWSVFDEAIQEFLPIDADIIKRKLKLSEQAKRNGISGLPPARSKAKDKVTLEIEQEIHDRVDQARAFVLNRVETDHNTTRFGFEAANEENIRARFHEELGLLYTIAETEDAHFKQAITEARREKSFLERFREENLLSGVAGGQSSFSKSPLLGWVLLTCAFEFLITLLLLGSVHPEAYRAVVIEALIFLTINVSLAAALGTQSFRYLIHVNKFKRLLVGVGSTILLVGLLFWLNFMLAHYRHVVSNISIDELSDLSGVAASTVISELALKNFISSPFSAENLDMMSILVGFASVCATLFLAYKFLDFDDRYPGYGRVSRKANQAWDHVLDLQEHLFERCDEIHQSFVNTNLLALRGLHDAIENGQSRSSAHVVLVSKFKDWLQTTERSANVLLSFYREENIRHRKTTDKVLCFEARFQFLPAKKN